MKHEWPINGETFWGCPSLHGPNCEEIWGSWPLPRGQQRLIDAAGGVPMGCWWVAAGCPCACAAWRPAAPGRRGWSAPMAGCAGPQAAPDCCRYGARQRLAAGSAAVWRSIPKSTASDPQEVSTWAHWNPISPSGDPQNFSQRSLYPQPESVPSACQKKVFRSANSSNVQVF